MVLPLDAAVRLGVAAQQRRAVRAAVEPDIDVAVAGDFHRRHALDRAQFLHQFGGDLLRGLPEQLGQLERRGDSHLAEIALPRLLNGDGQIYAVAHLDVRMKGARNLFFNGMEHGNSSIAAQLPGTASSRSDYRPFICSTVME